MSNDPIYANFTVSERTLLELRDQRTDEERETRNKKSKLYLKRDNDDGFPFEGIFDYADFAVDQGTGTFLLRGIFPNPEFKVFPGLFVTVRIPMGKTDDALLVPESAVSGDQAGRYVWLVGDDNVVSRANVRLGAKYQELIVVTEGLKKDDWVIIEGIQRARNKAKVSPEKSDLPDLGTEISTVKQEATPAVAGAAGMLAVLAVLLALAETVRMSLNR